MRACPATLLLSRGRSWHPCARLAAAVDVSENESRDLVQAIVETSKRLSEDCHGELDILYSEPWGVDPGNHEAHVGALHELTHTARLQPNSVHVLSGAAEQALPLFAAGRNYDVFIMGALTHRKELSALVGTLTARLIETLDCDFVLVKPSSYHSSVQLSSVPHPAQAEVEPVLGIRQGESMGFVAPWQLPAR